MPSHWLYAPDLDLLTDRAWRTYCGSLMWSAGAGTDGRLPVPSLRFTHPSGVDAATAAELVESGRWTTNPDGSYQVRDWERSQSLAADVEHQRERNRKKNQDLRARARANRDGTSDEMPGHVTGHEPGQVTGHTGGKERTGKAQLAELKLSGTAADESACVNCARLGENGPCNTHYKQSKSA